MKKIIIIISLLCATVCIVAQVPAGVPTSGLIAYYGFNGNANDLSGNNNNGTLGCAPGASNPTLVPDRFGAANSAYSFGGYDNRNWIKVNNSGSLRLTNAVTVSAWIRQTSTRGMDYSTGSAQAVNNNAHFTILAKGGLGVPTNVTPAVAAGFRLENCYINNSEQRFDIANTNTDQRNSDANISASMRCYSSGQWVHVVAILSPNNQRIYINGVLYNEMNGYAPNFTQANNNDMYIGRVGGGNEVIFPFSGDIDDIAIYNRAITDAEVDQLFGGYLDNQGENNRIIVDNVTVVNPCGNTQGRITISPRPVSGVNYQYSINSPNDLQASNILSAPPGTVRCYVVSDCALWDTVITLVCDCAGDESLTFYDSICPGECGQRGGIETVFQWSFDSWGDGPTRWTHGGSSGLDWTLGTGEPNYLEAMQWAPSHSGRTGRSAWYPTYQGYISRYDGYAITPPINISCDPTRASLTFYYMAEMIEDWTRGYNTFKVYYGRSLSGPWTQLFSSGGGDVASWRQATVSLANLPGSGTYYFKFASEGDGYVSALDDVKITCDTRWNVPNVVCQQGTPGSTVRTENVLENSGMCPVTEVTLWYIKPTTESHETITNPISYTWHGTTYTVAGDYSWNNGGRLKNHFGCDSTANLHLILDLNNSYHDYRTACDTLTWNGRLYRTSAEDSVKCYACNQWGGDSTTYLHLTMSYNSARDSVVVSCRPFVWIDTIFEESVSTMAHLYSIANCDSLVTLHFTRHHADTTYLHDTLCGGNTYNFAGQNYTEGGNYTAFLQTIHQCDSTVFLTLDYFPSYHIAVSDSIDQDDLPYISNINGESYNYELRNELIHYAAAGMCDSNYYLTLRIHYKLYECDKILQFPNIITPNGDGHNDRFYIVGIDEGCFPLNELRIYNRWGALVFRQQNISSPAETWEPTHMPAGTYFFRFEGRNSLQTIERFGAVEVIKE